MPQRIIGAAVMRRRFTQFANTNGLVYFGLLHPRDDHEPIRGFTANAGQIDNYAVYGNIHERAVTIFERTVTHAASLSRKGRTHSHTWLIAAVKHNVERSPHVLLLSHVHPRLHDEAVAIHHDRSQHVALDVNLDANFLVYAQPSDMEDIRENFNEEVIQQLLTKPGYDYEIDSQWVYVYSHNTAPKADELHQQFSAALALANVYEKSPE